MSGIAFARSHTRRIGLVLLALVAGGALVGVDLATLDTQRSELARLTASAASTPTAPTFGTIEDEIPALTAMPKVVEELLALGAPKGLTADQVRLALIENGNQRRYQVTLTLKGPYPAIRQFVFDALALRPGSRIDDIVFSRPTAAEPNIEAAMTLSFGLRSDP